MPAPVIEDFEQIVVFRLGDQEFGLEIAQVKEILNLVEITPMPNVPEAVAGMINVRGKIIPVVDLHKYLGLPPIVLGPTSRIIVVDTNGAMIGLQVDAATDVLRIARDSFEPTAEIMGSGRLENIKGIFKQDDRLVALLDIGDLLNIGAAAENRSDR
jgi:purine-binding chemotaxis protein CheW